MGGVSSLPEKVGESMKGAQRELQGEMMEKQLMMQMRGQERMMRMQLSMQVAMTRERLWWQGGLGTAFVAGVAAVTAKTGQFPKLAAVPLTVFWTVFAYQWDMAYHTKLNRIDKMAQEIRQDPNFWFSPILISEEEVKRRYPQDDNTAVASGRKTE